jgi:thiol-disulfide isomerase/thioredoxin
MLKSALPIALIAAVMASACQARTAAPRMGIVSYAQLKTPLPYPYDEAANADKVVDAARARAKAQRKILIVDLGGNWCGDCRILAGAAERPELKAFINKHFVMVTVDVGRFDKNLQIPARYGVTKRLEGVPALLVIDPRTDKLLNGGNVAELADARHMSPQALADWFARWVS